MVNEVYARAHLDLEAKADPEEALEALIEKVRIALETTIGQPDTAKVKVQRWFPGVVEEIVEEVDENRKSNVTQRLLKEAATILERKQHLQTTATKQNTISQLMGADVQQPEAAVGEETKPDNQVTFAGIESKPVRAPRPKRRVRQKMRSTPVVGGGLFGETIEAKSGREGSTKISNMHAPKPSDLNWSLGGPMRGVSAEISVKGEHYNIRISRDTLRDLQKGFSGQLVDSRGIEISGMNIAASNEDAPVVQRLQGFVRNMPLNQIREETIDEVSERSGDVSADNSVKDV